MTALIERLRPKPGETQTRPIIFVTQNPLRSCAAAALAEVTLRRSEPELERLLKENTLSQDYGVTAGFKVMAAVGAAEGIVEALFWQLENPLETNFRNGAYWVPSLLRRIESDPDVDDRLIEAVANAPSASAAISLLAPAGRGSKGHQTPRVFWPRNGTGRGSHCAAGRFRCDFRVEPAGATCPSRIADVAIPCRCACCNVNEIIRPRFIALDSSHLGAVSLHRNSDKGRSPPKGLGARKAVCGPATLLASHSGAFVAT
jgi:hypothetical protein